MGETDLLRRELADLKKRIYFCFQLEEVHFKFCFSGAWQQLFFKKQAQKTLQQIFCRTLIDTDKEICKIFGIQQSDSFD